ncbi:MAG: sigma-70 family RNA polymerase sigma factor [Deltaproteobacteria bacterium]|nr:sigma-70 family RNA polymerase sigma factor [Deltaproteobacteria bacterium]
MARPPPLDAAAEEALLLRARQGGRAREEVVVELFRGHRAPLLGVCLHLTGDRADAEDALQEAFLSAHRALPAFRGEARLSTWLWRIAVRAALEVRGRRRPAAPVDPELPAPPAEPPLLARDEARRVLAAMDRLPAEHRVVLSLFAAEGLRHREIAEILGVAEGTVWSRLHEARRRLAAALGRR